MGNTLVRTRPVISNKVLRVNMIVSNIQWSRVVQTGKLKLLLPWCKECTPKVEEMCGNCGIQDSKRSGIKTARQATDFATPCLGYAGLSAATDV